MTLLEPLPKNVIDWCEIHRLNDRSFMERALLEYVLVLHDPLPLYYDVNADGENDDIFILYPVQITEFIRRFVGEQFYGGVGKVHATFENTDKTYLRVFIHRI
jgi:hypothetical protein